MPNNNTYDAVIIGAGISGLVCGCYLAKAGMKVLIAEQHYKPGGYCTSFKRKGFTFDAAAHSFGGYRYGPLGNIFKGLEIDKKINILKFDPSDIVITPDYKVFFYTDIDKTIKDFQRTFPQDSDSINKFFHFLLQPDLNSFAKIRSWTFKNLLDQYFINEKLKSVLSFPIFGNSGLPPSLISAFLGSKIFKEFLLDGGYYPDGSMQALPNALSERLKEFGGELRLSCPVKKIRVKDNRVIGVVLEKDGFVPSKYVISNCDARQTFFKLLGRRIVKKDFLNIINNMVTSLSIFIAYLGVNNFLDSIPEPGANVWYLSHYNLDEAYIAAREGNFKNIGGYMVHVSPDKRNILAFMNAPFKNKKYWINNKMKILDYFIKRIELEVIPELSKHIIYKDAASPQTLYKYTSNYKGAAYGWAGTPSQLTIPGLRKPPYIQGLYLTGHWTTHGLGIPGVVYIGYDTAKIILRKEKHHI